MQIRQRKQQLLQLSSETLNAFINNFSLTYQSYQHAQALTLQLILWLTATYLQKNIRTLSRTWLKSKSLKSKIYLREAFKFALLKCYMPYADVLLLAASKKWAILEHWNAQMSLNSSLKNPTCNSLECVCRYKTSLRGLQPGENLLCCVIVKYLITFLTPRCSPESRLSWRTPKRSLRPFILKSTIMHQFNPTTNTTEHISALFSSLNPQKVQII